MRSIATALALIVLSGCATYVTEREFEVATLHAQYGKELAGFVQTWPDIGMADRQCRQDVKSLPGYPTVGQASMPGGMDRAAIKIEQMTNDCMARKGYRPAG